MDLGIRVKLFEFEQYCDELKSRKISKKDLKKLKKDFNDIKYYIKKEAKRENITNYNDIIYKYDKMYREISETNT